MKLENKVALITGGNSGIGLATARRFAAEGARVVVTGRNRQRLEQAAIELGPNVVALEADVIEEAACETAVSTAIERFGRLDMPGGTRTPLWSTVSSSAEPRVTSSR